MLNSEEYVKDMVIEKIKVLIICGWHEMGGEYYKKVTGTDISDFDIIIGFEASKDFDADYERDLISRPTRDKVTLLNKAVWVHDGEITFYDLGGESSSVMSGKTTGKQGMKPYKVEAIDFPNFLEKFDKGKFDLFIQMNIEGSEFEILDKMFDRGTFDKVCIKQLLLDNHTNFEGQEKVLKETVQRNRTRLRKYFNEHRRPRSRNPEDFMYIRPM